MSLDGDIRAIVRDVVMTDVVPVVVREMKAALDALGRHEPHAAHPELLRVCDVAREARVAEGTVQEWIRRGLLKASTLPGGREYRIRRADLDRAMARAAEASAPGPDDEAERILSLRPGKLLQRNGGR